MSDKSLKILALTLSFFLLLLGLRYWRSKKTFSSSSSLYEEKIKKFDKNSLSLITIKNKDNYLELKKEKDIWKIKDKKADALKITNLVNQLFNPSLAELIAQTDKKHQDLNLTDDSALFLAFNNQLTFLLGKNEAFGIFIRFYEEDPVFLLKTSLPYNLSDENYWYDLTIFNLNKEKINALFLQKRDKSLELNKKNNKWIEKDKGKEIKNEVLDSLFEELVTFKAYSFYQEEKEENFSSLWQLALTFDYGEEKERFEFYQGEENYLAKRMSDQEKFLISNFSYSSLEEKIEEIFKSL